MSDTPSTLPAETAHMNAVVHSASRLVGVTKADDSGADQVIVLGSVDVEFATGAVAALLVGPPGSGKSALMHFLTGSTS
jgi:ABC-type lipoprotein export system ATPase subunit